MVLILNEVTGCLTVRWLQLGRLLGCYVSGWMLKRLVTLLQMCDWHLIFLKSTVCLGILVPIF
jgi:hypothetical protein